MSDNSILVYDHHSPWLGCVKKLHYSINFSTMLLSRRETFRFSLEKQELCWIINSVLIRVFFKSSQSCLTRVIPWQPDYYSDLISKHSSEHDDGLLWLLKLLNKCVEVLILVTMLATESGYLQSLQCPSHYLLLYSIWYDRRKKYYCYIS